MTDRYFNTLIKEFEKDNKSSVKQYKGTIDHSALSNILEGLIIHIFKQGVKVNTLKYKFPRYTIDTFLFRDLLKSKSSDGIPFLDFSYSIDTFDVDAKVDSYVKRWVPEEAHDVYRLSVDTL
jgi:hypothetical protein